MNIFDKILDAYYDVRFKVEDAYYAIRYKITDLVNGVKNTSDKVVKELEEEFVKPAKRKKAKTKKKKK